MRLQLPVHSNDYKYRLLQPVKRFSEKMLEHSVNSEDDFMPHTMMQVCKETDMTYQALKFYCNEGLVPNVKRDKNNRRVFDERDVA